MAKNRFKKTSKANPFWLVVSSLLMALIVMESLFILTMALHSMDAAKGQTLSVVEPNTAIRGATFPAMGEVPGIDKPLLNTLNQYRERRINFLRVPTAPLLQDGAVANLVELFFQSDFKVLLAPTVTDSGAFSDVWTQIDTTFGRRTDRELWYEVKSDNLQQLTNDLQTLREITTKNPRTLVAVLPESVLPQDLSELVQAVGSERLVLAAESRDEAAQDALAKAAEELNVTFLYLAPTTASTPYYLATKPNYCLGDE